MKNTNVTTGNDAFLYIANNVMTLNSPLALVWISNIMGRGCYSVFDKFAAAKTAGELKWPDYCPLPISAATAPMTPTKNNPSQYIACWSWLHNRKVYDFEPRLMDSLVSLANTRSETDIVPYDSLTKLPHKCVFIRFPTGDINGFFAWCEYDSNRGEAELRLQVVSDHYKASIPYVMHLLPGKTYLECMRETFEECVRNSSFSNSSFLKGVFASGTSEFIKMIQFYVEILLYLTSENADIQDNTPDEIVQELNCASINYNIFRMTTAQLSKFFICPVGYSGKNKERGKN